MTLPVKYRKDPPYVATYPYSEIADGIGYSTFYGFSTKNSGTTALNLNTQILPSADIEIDIRSSNGTRTFTSPTFKKPKRIEGTVFVTFSFETGNSSARTITVTLYDSGDNSLGTANTGSTSSYNTETRICLSFDVSKTDFAIDDYFYLTVVDSSDASTNIIGIDPLNASGTTLTNPSTHPTQFKVLIPFKLNI